MASNPRVLAEYSERVEVVNGPSVVPHVAQQRSLWRDQHRTQARHGRSDASHTRRHFCIARRRTFLTSGAPISLLDKSRAYGGFMSGAWSPTVTCRLPSAHACDITWMTPVRRPLLRLDQRFIGNIISIEFA
jgi:hypothetical protein